MAVLQIERMFQIQQQYHPLILVQIEILEDLLDQESSHVDYRQIFVSLFSNFLPIILFPFASAYDVTFLLVLTSSWILLDV